MNERMDRKSFLIIFIIIFVLVLLGALIGFLYREYNKLDDTTHKFNVPVSKYIIIDGTMVKSDMVEIKEMVLDSTDGIVMDINDVVGKCVKNNVKVDAGKVFKVDDIEECN